MIFLNPQWQGSGTVRELEDGARTLSAFINKPGTIEVPLSHQSLDVSNGIFAYEPIRSQLESFYSLVASHAPENISTIGGECGIELIPVSYLNKYYNQDLALLWFDGHADLNSPETSPSRHFHGMPVRFLLGEGDPGILKYAFSSLQQEQIIYVGVNDTDPAEENYILANNIDRVSSPDYSRIHKLLTQKKRRNIYIHFDLDVLSEKEFSFTPYPNRTGFGIAETCRIIVQLRQDFNVVGTSVTESIALKAEQLMPIAILLKALIP